MSRRDPDVPRSKVLLLAVADADGMSSSCEPKLKLEEEQHQIESTLAHEYPQSPLDLIRLPIGSVDELSNLLDKQRPTVLYLAGHGSAGQPDADRGSRTPRDVKLTTPEDAPGICLPNDRGQWSVLTAPILARMVQPIAPPLRGVMLNACHSSQMAGPLCDAGVDWVLTIDGEISDDAAMRCAVEFFGALGDRKSVGAAYERARMALARNGYPDERLVRLQTRAGVEANRVFVSNAQHGLDGRVSLDTERTEITAPQAPALLEHRVRRGCFQGALAALAVAGAAAAIVEWLLQPSPPASALPQPVPVPLPVVPFRRPSQINSAPAERMHAPGVPPGTGSDTVPRDDRSPPPGAVWASAAAKAPAAAQAPDTAHGTDTIPAHIATPAHDGVPDPIVTRKPGPVQGPETRRTGLVEGPLQDEALMRRPGPRPRSPARAPAAVALQPWTALPPQQEAAAPKGLGDLDPDVIQRYMGYHHGQIRHCYEVQRMTTPALTGTVTAAFLITPEGRVAASTATGLDQEVAACVAGIIRGIGFPRSGSGSRVRYPFHFKPLDGR